MMRIYVLFLVLPNIICFRNRFSDYELRKNNGPHIKKGNDDTSVSIKEVSLPNSSRTDQNVSDIENVDGSKMSESRNYINDEISSMKERSANKRPVRTDYRSKAHDDLNKTSKSNNNNNNNEPTPCQHVHIHLNGTESEKRTAWQFGCVFVFVLIIVVILLLNCFHYYYGLGVNYTNNDEAKLLFDGTVGDRRSELLLCSNNS